MKRTPEAFKTWWGQALIINLSPHPLPLIVFAQTWLESVPHVPKRPGTHGEAKKQGYKHYISDVGPRYISSVTKLTFYDFYKRYGINIFSNLASNFLESFSLFLHKRFLSFDYYIQGDPKGSERFFKNGCGIQMSQATPTKFSMLFKHNYGQLF